MPFEGSGVSQLSTISFAPLAIVVSFLASDPQHAVSPTLASPMLWLSANGGEIVS
jgi:hypothetical protein